MHTSDRNHFSSVIILQTQPSLLVKVSTLRLHRDQRGFIVAVLAWRSLVMRGWLYFRVGLGLTDSIFDRMVDAGRTTRGRKVVVFVFFLGRGTLEGGMQMMGGECATDVLVNVPGGLHSKFPRTGARETGKEGLLESAGVKQFAASGE